MTTTEPERTLTRPKSGRIVAGVAAGLAARTDLPVWLVRIGFVALAAADGAGVLLYLAAWALIPEEGDTRPAASRWADHLQGGRGLVGLGLLALALVIVADNTGIVDGDLTLAAVLFVVGFLLYRGELRRSPDDEKETTMTTTTTGGSRPGGPLAGQDPVPPPPPPPPTTNPPPPPPPPAPMRPAPPPSHLGRFTIAAVFVALGVLGLFDTLGTVDVRARQYAAAALVVMGAGLVVGAVFGRARWLIVLGIFLLPVVLVSPVADRGFVGDFEAERIRHEPATVGEIADSYRADVGDMVIDLGAVDFDGQTVTVDASIDVGEVVVIVPDDVAVEATGRTNVGQVDVLGHVEGGLGEIAATRTISGSNGTLIVEATTNLGRVEITREGPVMPDVPEVPDAPEAPGDLDLVVDSPSELDSRYEVGAGNVILDLSGLRLENPRDVDVIVGSGNVTVVLPETGDVEVQAAVGAGDLVLPDDEWHGTDLADDYLRGADPVLVLDIEVDTGTVTIEEAA